MNQPLLELQNLSLSYHTMEGEVAALSDISFSVREGEFAAVVGPSGCGKSTILNLISGLLPIEKGEIFFRGEKLSKDSPLNIGYMLQKDHLFEWRTVYKNIILGLEIRRQMTPENLARADALIDQYGLSSFRDARPSQLSGGMRQRAALIRTMVLDPDLMLLDEPFSALDYQTRLSVADDIGTILRSAGKTAILVTHDISEAVSMADRVIVLSSRPARIRTIIPISLSLGNTPRTPMTSRNAPDFKTYFNLIWKELHADA
ncbi:MAG TPA: ABC transporter ATP-binding protein [Candidatus Egerieimonas faecigallinarum]|nr:ABC transporter ATP-binding protein [Candidatus Egerieimonas faecigallinarum]